MHRAASRVFTCVHKSIFIESSSNKTPAVLSARARMQNARNMARKATNTHTLPSAARSPAPLALFIYFLPPQCRLREINVFAARATWQTVLKNVCMRNENLGHTLDFPLSHHGSKRCMRSLSRAFFHPLHAAVCVDADIRAHEWARDMSLSQKWRCCSLWISGMRDRKCTPLVFYGWR